MSKILKSISERMLAAERINRTDRELIALEKLIQENAQLKARVAVLESALKEAKVALEKGIGFYSKKSFLLKQLYKLISPQAVLSNEEERIVRLVEKVNRERKPKEIHKALAIINTVLEQVKEQA